MYIWWKKEAYRLLSVHHANILRAFGGNYENYNKDKMKPLNIGDWGRGIGVLLMKIVLQWKAKG